MATLNFEKFFPEPKVITLLGEQVEVKQYLPMNDKMNLLEMIIQTADAGTILNTLVLDAIFETYLIFKYTDIEFTDEEKENILTTYDALETNGIITEVVKVIPESEYALLRNNLEEMVEDYKYYRNSAKGCVDSLLLFAPSTADKINSALSELDTEKFQNVVSLAEATGFRKQ